MQVLRFASIYEKSAFLKAADFSSDTHASLHRWGAGIVNQAFQQVMGRTPTPAERQIVMAVSDLESNYGKGWKENKGKGSHNWGAIQTSNKETPSFSHQDSSAKGKYKANFKKYPDDISGAADVIRNLFRANGKQRMPDPNNANRATGTTVNGPGRGELIEQAAQQGDTNAFSRAMWYTSYFEGTAPDWTERIRVHANAIQNIINSIASALGEPAAWSQKSPGNSQPVTNDSNVLMGVNAPMAQKQQTNIESLLPQKPQGQETSLESMLWFN